MSENKRIDKDRDNVLIYEEKLPIDDAIKGLMALRDNGVSNVGMKIWSQDPE